MDDGQGTTTSGTFAINVTPIGQNVINIDQSWLNAQGAGPYYLDQQGKTYVLRTDVTTDGTAFAIIARDITFDLNGHTITYGNAPPIDIVNHSFENGTGTSANGWDFSNAPNAQRFQGIYLHNEVYDGTHSLKYSVPAGDQYVTSTSTITLEANTTYSLSAMFEYGGQGDVANPGVKGYVQLLGTGLPTREVYWDQTNWRGIQFVENEFTTGGSQEVYTVRVGIVGGSAAPATNLFIDDIKVQRTKVYGVIGGLTNAAKFPGVTRTGTGLMTVRNGTITQGTDGATWSHGLVIHAFANGSTYHDLEIVVNGANSSVIQGRGFTTQTVTIRDNVLTSNVQTITSRDQFHGAMISNLNADIFGNTLTNGPQSGIVAGKAASNIHDNTIRLKTKYTNAFGIVANHGSQIYKNLIENGVGENTGRGIWTKGDSDPALITRIYENTIKVQEGANNQEYEGPVLGGSYGIQVENSKNVEVYANDVYAYANAVKASAMRINNDGGTSLNVRIWNNTFRAISNGSPAHGVKLTSVRQGELVFQDNTIVTNDGIITGAMELNVELIRTHLRVTNPIANPAVFSIKQAWFPQSIKFIDTSFEDTASRNYFDNAIIQKPNGINTNASFTSSWTTTISVVDSNNVGIANGNVLIVDKFGTVIYSGFTDVNGNIEVVLDEFRTDGNTKTVFNPYSITVSALGQQVLQQLIVDNLLVVLITVNVAP